MGSTSGIDLLYDLEEQLPTEKKFTTSKLVFAQEMLRFQGLIKTDKANAAKAAADKAISDKVLKVPNYLKASTKPNTPFSINFL